MFARWHCRYYITLISCVHIAVSSTTPLREACSRGCQALSQARSLLSGSTRMGRKWSRTPDPQDRCRWRQLPSYSRTCPGSHLPACTGRTHRLRNRSNNSIQFILFWVGNSAYETAFLVWVWSVDCLIISLNIYKKQTKWLPRIIHTV